MPKPIVVAALLLAAGAAGAQTPGQSAPKTAKPVEANPSMCIGCHGIPGYKNSFPTVYSVPLIQGQPAKYLEAALQAYQRGERPHPTMQAIAKGLTDEQIAALAAMYGTKDAGAK